MQNILFSIYCGFTVSICYKLSRGSSNPNVLWNMIKHDLLNIKRLKTENDDIQDPLPDKLKTIVKERLQSDCILCFLIFIVVFAAHASTTFTSLQVCFIEILVLFIFIFHSYYLADIELYHMLNRYCFGNYISLYIATTS